MKLGCVLVLYNVLFLSIVSGKVLPNNDLYRLDIVHYNDFHDRFEETSVAYPVCKTNDTQCLGGFARLYYEIKTLLKEKPEALLLNAGDTYQGTYWYTLLKWHITLKFINMLPNDAHALGNHEFDGGVAGLVPYLAALRGPVLAANMDTSKEPSLNGLYKPHVIVERKGRRIGIIGVATPETMVTSNAQNVIINDPIEAARREADILTEKGVDIIIVLSHCGLKVDKQMAREIGENIDVIVGGHSHSLLWNGESPSQERISGPYPVEVEAESKPGHKVLVVTASAFTKYLGNLTIYFDDKGDIQSFDEGPVFLNRSIPEDPEILALLQPYKNKLHSLVNEVVGVTNVELDVEKCGSNECELGNLIADAFLHTGKEMNVSSLPTIAFLLRNMIRGSIPKGDVSRGSLINILPFTNKVVTFALPGRSLQEFLEKCLTFYWSLNPFNSPWMPQIAGFRVTFNTTSMEAVSVSVQEGDKFQPLDMEKEYQVVSQKFLLRGGNGFQILKENARNVTKVGVDVDLLEKYFRRISPITPYLDNRLTVVT